VRADGTLQPGASLARYNQAVADGDGARQRAYIGAGAAVVFAAAAGILLHLSREPAQAPAIRF
jgi:hypothetical protein